MPINVTSEIGKLKKVMLHRPGVELEHLVPGSWSVSCSTIFPI